MTQLNDDLVNRIARLCRLKLKDDELHRYKSELNKILKYFDELSNIQTEDETSLMSLSDDSVSRLRNDETKDVIQTADFLNQTPDREGVFLKVPAVLERIT